MRFNKNEQNNYADNSKKYVTFSKNTTEIVPELYRQTSTSCSEDSQKNIKPDLPGRVSFSKADVYEMDYSDYENEANDQDKEQINDYSNGNIKKYCCELKCNSATCTTERKSSVSNSSASGTYTVDSYTENMEKYPTKMNENKKKVYVAQHYQADDDDDESDKIIENYKREIETINQQHTNDGNYFNSKNSSPQRSCPDESSSSSKTSNDQITEISWNQNNLNNNKPEISSNSTKTQNQKINGKDKSSAVINNYLKATNQENCASSSKKKNNLVKTVKRPKETNKSKLQLENNTKSRTLSGKKIQSKSSTSRGGCDDSSLEEFHLDKVESWMSIHEFGKEEREKKNAGSADNISDASEYNSNWRETPNSKTDDEGNFSYEDQIDSISNAESTYDEIVSVIKEIEQEKTQELGVKNSATSSNDLTLKLQSISQSITPGRHSVEDPNRSPDKMK